MGVKEQTRNRVAIAGQLSNAETGQVIHRARIEITKMPDSFKNWLTRRAMQYGTNWETMVERPDRTQTAIDGHFHFLDLPDGDYTLTASLPGTGTCYGAVEKKVQVSRNDNKIKLAAADIALPTTGIKGQITRKDSSQKSVVMAKIQVEGSGESTFSNKEGEYKLIGLQAANNVKVKVFVRGNEVTHKSETVICGEMKTLDFEL